MDAVVYVSFSWRCISSRDGLDFGVLANSGCLLSTLQVGAKLIFTSAYQPLLSPRLGAAMRVAFDFQGHGTTWHTLWWRHRRR